MPTTRMNREQFYARLAALDEAHLKKALWTLYWRGSATVRERVEAEVDADQNARRQPPAKDPIDPEWTLSQVRDFAALARSGAYLAGDRRVSPRERTRWRFTFQRLVSQAQKALRDEDVEPGAAAVEHLVDLACELRDFDYFRSEDPLAAARVVVSDLVAQLWQTMRDRHGFNGFAERAAAQLIRWESRYGWTRSGDGPVAERETTLARVLASMLTIPDTWVTFADRYLDALDQVAEPGASTSAWRSTRSGRDRRTADLAEWHLLLLDRLADSEADDRLDRLALHAGLGGPELSYLQARLAHARGDVSRAHDLVHEALVKLPGHSAFLRFAAEIDAPLPPRAQQIVKEPSY